MARPSRPDPASGNVVPFRRPARGNSARGRAVRQDKSERAAGGGRGFLILLVTLPLAAFAAVFLWQGPPPVAAQGLLGNAAAGADRESASFGLCSGPVRYSCVVDGDTFWYRGTKIRIADINAPERSDPQCAAEAQLAERATHRLAALLSAGPFSLEDGDRSEDSYGRALKVVRRGGQSLGLKLVAEGLAERWKGYRGEWC